MIALMQTWSEVISNWWKVAVETGTWWQWILGGLIGLIVLIALIYDGIKTINEGCDLPAPF